MTKEIKICHKLTEMMSKLCIPTTPFYAPIAFIKTFTSIFGATKIKRIAMTNAYRPVVSAMAQPISIVLVTAPLLSG